jgi:pimeloyl-ACP methyl ester carboxylesterase
MVVVAIAALVTAAGTARADDKIGIVLMHGKQGTPLGIAPPGSNRPPAGGQLVDALTSAGYLVTQPEMCWSRNRSLDKPFAECLTEIDSALADLKKKGATAFIVAGLSQGGLAAIAYGARHSDILGVIAYAAADDPVGKARLSAVARAIDKAKQMVANGAGGETSSFDDVNTGPQGSFSMSLRTTADIYLSFYAPDAETGIARNMANLKVPILWVYSENDPSQRNATNFFAKAPPNPLNRQVTVFANHVETVNAGRAATLAWIADLAKAR